MMEVTLRYGKGFKNDPRKAKTNTFYQHDSGNRNITDLIQMITLHALRVGTVSQTTWTDLHRVMMLNPQKGVTWTRPEDPVFYASLNGGIDLNFKMAARIADHY